MMNYKYTDKMYQLKNTAMAEYTLLARRNMKDGEKLVNFASGYPADSELQDELVGKYLSKAMEMKGKDILQYGSRAGYPKLRQTLKEYLLGIGNYISETDDLIVTYGATEALALVTSAFVEKGDRVIVETPTYYNILKMVKSNGGEVVAVPFENDGADLNRLEQEMKKGAKFYYTISNFSNPTGITTSEKKRKEIYRLALQYQIPVVEDDPYGHLRYEGERIPNIKEYDHEGVVIYVGSISKLISPGMRIGYIVAESGLCDRLVNLKSVVSSSVTNVTQYALDLLFQNEDISKIKHRLITDYSDKLSIVKKGIQEAFSPKVRCQCPEGGMYVWISLPSGENMREFCRIAATDLHVPVTPGFDFCADNLEECTGMRLNFVRESKEDIAMGIQKLGQLSYDFLK